MKTKLFEARSLGVHSSDTKMDAMTLSAGLRDTLSRPGAQSKYGIYENVQETGELKLSFKTKALNALYILGGVSDLIERKLASEGIMIDSKTQ